MSTIETYQPLLQKCVNKKNWDFNEETWSIMKRRSLKGAGSR